MRAIRARSRDCAQLRKSRAIMRNQGAVAKLRSIRGQWRNRGTVAPQLHGAGPCKRATRRQTACARTRASRASASCADKLPLARRQVLACLLPAVVPRAYPARYGFLCLGRRAGARLLPTLGPLLYTSAAADGLQEDAEVMAGCPLGGLVSVQIQVRWLRGDKEPV